MNGDELRMRIGKLKGYGFWRLTPTPANDAVLSSREFVQFFEPFNLEDYKNNEYWNCEQVEWPADWQREPGLRVLPNWPADTATAWQLVDEIEAAGLRWMMYTLPSGSKNFAIFEPIVLENEESWNLLAEEQGETAALAICLAYSNWKEANDADPQS